jgi:WD40 repeat protein
LKTRSPHLTNPFPGLRPFRSDEHHLFFGREEQTAALLQLLRTNRFLAVVGTSGSGKSSLVRAGMIAALHGGTMTQAGSTWEVIILRPGGSPVENLARAFVDANPDDAGNSSTLPRLLATLNRSRFGLVEAMKQSEVFGSGVNLLVVVDQFEELFRFRQQGVDSEETASAFVNLLLTASEQTERPIYVAITMRSDYLGDCSEIPGLAEAVNKGEYLIPRLLRDQKRDAIEKPIGVGGAKVSPMLVQRLLNEVGDDPDQLPVLQHALMRMWDVWSSGSDPNRPIDFGDFEATGGLASALSNHADEVYESLPDERHRNVCEKIFKTLTEKGDDNRGIRRPTRLAHLQAIAAADRDMVTAVLDAYRGAGVTFLMPGAEVILDDRTVLDLSHESLMRGWERLRGWVEEEAQSARIFRRLLDTARLWSDGKAGLFRDPDLQIARSWREQEQPNAEWAEQYGGGFDAAIEFLETSSAEAEAERYAKEAARQRELEQARELAEARQQRLIQQQRSAARMRAMIAGLGVVAAIAVGTSLVAGKFWREANIAKLNAETNANTARENAEAARKSELLAQTEATRANEQRRLAEENVIKAETAESKATQQRKRADDAAEATRQNLYYAQSHLAQQAWREHRGVPHMRELLANWLPMDGSPDRRGWEWFYLNSLPYQNLRTLTDSGSDKGPCTVAWHLASKRLAEGTADGLIRIWDVDREKTTLLLKAPLPWLQYWGGNWFAWSPDGGKLASGCRDGTVHLWDARTGGKLRVLSGQTSPVLCVSFSSDGVRLAAWGLNGRIKIWDVATGRSTADIVHPGNVSTGAWSPNDKLLASGNRDGTLTISGTQAGAEIVSLRGHSDTIYHVAWSLDSSRLASTSANDFFLSVWDVATKKMVLGPLRHSHGITSIAWEPGGRRLASGSMDEAVKIWDASTGREELTLRGHRAAITSLAWGPDGRLASGGSDGSMRIRTSIHDQEWSVLPGHAVRATSVAWSPDGTRLASGGDDGKLTIWDPVAHREVRTIEAHNKARIVSQFGLIRSVAWSPDGTRLASAGLDGATKVWEAATGRELFSLPADRGAVWSVTWSPGGTYLASGAQDGTICLVERPGDSSKVHVIKAHDSGANTLNRRGGVRSLSWSPKENRLASTGWDSLVKIWDPIRGTELASMKGHSGWVMSVAWSPDGKRLASAGGDRLVITWEAETGRKLQTLRGHNDFVDAVVWSPDGARLASAGIDNSVRVWDPFTGEETFVLRGNSGMFHDLSWSRDGARLAAPASDGAIWIWDATPGFERDTTPRALPYIDRKVASKTARGEDLLWCAQSYIRAGKHREALAAVKDDPDGLGQVARQFGKAGNAPLAAEARSQTRALLERQLAAEPNNSALASELAELLLTDPRGAALKLTDPWVKLAAGYRVVGDQKAFEQLLKRHPAAAAAVGDLNAAEENWDLAIAAYSNLITARPADGNLLVKRAKAYEATKRWDLAEADWKRAARQPGAVIEPTRLLVQSGVRALESGRRAEAIRDLSRARDRLRIAVQTAPEEGLAATQLGISLGFLGSALRDERQFAEAKKSVQECRQVLEAIRQPSSLDLYNLACAYANLAVLAENGSAPSTSAEREALAARSVEILRRSIAGGMTDFDAMERDHDLDPLRSRADFRALMLEATGRPREAIPHLAAASAANPKDSDLSLKVAALQAWFGQEKELAATRRRILASAKGATEAVTVERAVRACGILPSVDKAELDAARALAQTTADVGKSRQCHLLALGMVEYRSGRFSSADAALLAANKARPADRCATGTAAYYRAMSLFRQGKHDEARRVAIAAAADMKPPPADEKNPLAGNASSDDLILWLACKEAKAMIKFDTTPAAPATSSAK